MPGRRRTRQEVQSAQDAAGAEPENNRNEVEEDNPQDENPPTVQEQIEQLSATLNDHAQTLEGLKNVPTILAAMSRSMGLDNEEDGSSSTQMSNIDIDTGETDLLANFMADVEHGESGSNELNPDEPDSEMLEILNLTQPVSEYGEELNPNVAKSFACMVADTPNRDLIDGWKKKFKPPSNCKLLGVPRVNTEIWPHLKPRARHGDLSLQQHGAYVSQASVAVSKIADTIFAKGKLLPKDVAQELLKLTMDAGSILGLASQELSGKRKAEMKPFLNKDVVGICSSKTPTTEWLFGDNVVDKLKASKNAASVIKPVFTGFRNNRNHPYKPTQNLNFQRPPYQAKGGRYTPRPQRQFQPRSFNSQAPPPPPPPNRRQN